MPKRLLFLLLLGLLVLRGAAADVAELTLSDYEKLEGFVDLYWDVNNGRVLLNIEQFDTPFIYQASLPRGVGSNDLGLDRGQLGATRLVRFIRSGPKVLLVEDNLRFRATTDNPDEQRAVAESFARSVIWGFRDIDPSAATIVDATSFFLSDTHGVARRLRALSEGSYVPDESRSAIDMQRTRAFPDNIEVEAIVTFAGDPAGRHLPTVVPDATAVTVHLHHSMIRLPDGNYEPLPYDPRSGIIGLRYDAMGYADYAAPIGETLSVDYGRRHRLEKVDPDAAISDVVEPIVYYLDRGAPEPVRSALLEGAQWWNQAFEAAGYRNAFQVKILPEGADPLDVRYNVIQWVHRSTRGWSYGSSVLDPRTGEIIKGHVSLGSLRVRQDYLIAEGLLSPYEDDSVPSTMIDMSLARIRQLSAHEVGHTLGFEHNFAASTQNRASVMDYPFPLITIDDNGDLDFSAAYDDKIGSWDKRMVLYAYQDFPDSADADAERRRIMDDTIARGYKYVGDGDSRSVSTSHPDGNLWDNGADAIAELRHLLAVRSIALEHLSENTIRTDRPLATLEEALVPVYLLHRFQIQAVGKLIGGRYFNYKLRGDAQDASRPVAVADQQRAIDALLATLDPDLLRLPPDVVELILPRVPNSPKSRESFTAATGINFDTLAPARSAVALTLQVLLDRTRAARMTRAGAPGFGSVTRGLLDASWYAKTLGAIDGAIQRQTNLQVLYALLRLASDTSADGDARALALDAVAELERWLQKQAPRDALWRAHYRLARAEIERLKADPAALADIVPRAVPPGSPIGALSTLDF